MIRLTVALPTVKNYLIIYEMSLKISETAVIEYQKRKRKKEKKGGSACLANQEIRKFRNKLLTYLMHLSVRVKCGCANRLSV